MQSCQVSINCYFKHIFNCFVDKTHVILLQLGDLLSEFDVEEGVYHTNVDKYCTKHHVT